MTYEAAYTSNILLAEEKPNNIHSKLYNDHYSHIDLNKEECHDGYDDYNVELSDDDIHNSDYEQKTPMENITASILKTMKIGTSMLSFCQKLFHQQKQLPQAGEGSSLIRFLSFLGGFAMFTISLLYAFNFFSIFSSPFSYLLHLYQGFLGILIMVAEANDWECLDQFKPWVLKWFKFLSVPLGKGIFYIFIGSMGVSMLIHNILAFTIGLYMSYMGCVYLAVYFGVAGYNKPITNSHYAYDDLDENVDDRQKHLYYTDVDKDEYTVDVLTRKSLQTKQHGQYSPRSHYMGKYAYENSTHSTVDHSRSDIASTTADSSNILSFNKSHKKYEDNSYNTNHYNHYEHGYSSSYNY